MLTSGVRMQAENIEPLETTFELNDTLYAKAVVDAGNLNEVYLWLGANVMLSYPIEEAEVLLEEKLSAAKRSLDNCEEDLEFLREQITVCALFLCLVPLSRQRRPSMGESDGGQGP